MKWRRDSTPNPPAGKPKESDDMKNSEWDSMTKSTATAMQSRLVKASDAFLQPKRPTRPRGAQRRLDQPIGGRIKCGSAGAMWPVLRTCAVVSRSINVSITRLLAIPATACITHTQAHSPAWQQPADSSPALPGKSDGTLLSCNAVASIPECLSHSSAASRSSIRIEAAAAPTLEICMWVAANALPMPLAANAKAKKRRNIRDLRFTAG